MAVCHDWANRPFNPRLFLSYFSWCVFNVRQRACFTLKLIHVDSPLLIEFESPQHLPLSSSWSWVVYLWPPRITISGLLGVGEKEWDWIGCVYVCLCAWDREKICVRIFAWKICMCFSAYICLCVCFFFFWHLIRVWLWVSTHLSSLSFYSLSPQSEQDIHGPCH